MKWVTIDEAVANMSYKFFGLSELKRSGIKIPKTYGLVADRITVEAVRAQRPMIEDFLAAQLDADMRYCVRSAKGEEDSLDSSKAGQFVTVLDLVTVQEVYHGMEEVAASYEAVAGSDSSKQDVIMVQEMIKPVYSGVLFSKNPVTSANELLLEAVQGLGDQLVQGGTAPIRLKYKWKQLLYDSDEQLPIPAAKVVSFCRDAARVERRVGVPIDVEWAYDGSVFIWLQVRPITTGQTYNVYKNDIAKNYLPGLIKPLVWDINIPVVNQAWVELLESIIGDTGLRPEELAKPFYYQAYFNMGILGGAFRKMGFREAFLEELQGIHDERVQVKFRPTLGMLRMLPRMASVYRRFQNTYRNLDKELEAYHQRSLQLETAIAEARSYEQLLELFPQLQAHNQKGAMYNIILPLMIYSKQRRYLNAVKDMQMQLPASAYLQENALYEPDSFLSCERTRSREEQKALMLERFGHFSANTNDFSQPTWREKQDILDTLLATADGSEADASEGRPLLSRRFLRQKAKADLVTHKKNKLSYFYAYSYHLFRKLFLRLGAVMVEQDALAAVDDIFYLNLDDIIQFAGDSYQAKAARVKEDMMKAQEYRLPAIIKGDEPPFILAESEIQDRFQGYPASAGRVQGLARVVRGLEDFGKVDEGDIIVVQNAEMGYLPLLRKAGAIVAETGAMLSHIAILARERRIPCVISAKNIMDVADGTPLVVDAYNGEVLVVEDSAQSA